jgi:hypothetical protein
MAATTSFNEHIEEIARLFLQTVVVVDDEALDPNATAVRAGIVTPGAIEKTPGRRSGPGGGPTDVPSETGTEAAGEPQPNVHDLDPKEIIDAFARRGLVCSVLSPRENEDVAATLVPAAGRADLVIFDWVLNGDNGETTMELIRRVLAEEAQPGPPRLRTIAIYTGQDALEDVARDVRKVLDAFYEDSPLAEVDGGLTMTRGPVRITILAKADVDLEEHLEQRATAVRDLPALMCREFAALSAGLVTGVALASLGALRSDTHRILKALSPELDPSYLGHRSALVDPPDSEQTLTDLVAEELRSVIDDHAVGANANHLRIKRWLELRETEGRTLGRIKVDDTNLTLSDEDLLTMLKTGLGGDSAFDAFVGRVTFNEKKLRKVMKRATELFVEEPNDARRSDAALSELMAVRTRYSNPPRTLRLGTIVADGDDLFVCVQPVCDSIRVRSARSFPFLPIRRVSDAKGADLMIAGVGSGNDSARLRIDIRPQAIRMIECAPTGGGVVAAENVDEVPTFTTEQGRPLQWIAELKETFAQRVATELAHALGRIALDEHELMRLSRSGE